MLIANLGPQERRHVKEALAIHRNVKVLLNRATGATSVRFLGSHVSREGCTL